MGYYVSFQNTLHSPPPPPILSKNKHGNLASSVECQEEGEKDMRRIDFDRRRFAIHHSPGGGRREALSLRMLTRERVFREASKVGHFLGTLFRHFFVP